MEKEKSFENMLTELESIVKQLESKDISLDDAVKNYKTGIEISKKCYKKIEEAEQLIIKEIKE